MIELTKKVIDIPDPKDLFVVESAPGIVHHFKWGEQVADLELSPDATVADAKEKVAQHFGTFVGLVTLLFLGKQLRDSTKLFTLRIRDEHFVIFLSPTLRISNTFFPVKHSALMPIFTD